MRHQHPQTTEIYISEQEDTDVSLANDVYNTIFNTSAIDITKELKEKINTLDLLEVNKVLNYIKEIKGYK